MDEQALQRDVLVTFEYAHHREDWVNPVEKALAGVTVPEALWKPDSEAKGIWEIVLHMAVWTELVVQRLRGEKPGKPAEGAWPPLPAVQDEATWQTSQQRLRDALTAFRTQIAGTSPALLLDCPDENGSLLDDILCRYIHNAYHLGQITKLRECWRAL